MKYQQLTRSVIITGASTTGKTTLFRRLVVQYGLEPVPVHTTRDARDGEVRNVDATFVSEEEFRQNFLNGEYLQESIESAYFGGAYYGCPQKWTSLTVSGDYNCFPCPTVKIAKSIKEQLGEKVFWIHLIADKDVRHQRLLKRGSSLKKEDFDIRIERGDMPVDITGHDLLIDTSYLNAWEIFFRAVIHL